MYSDYRFPLPNFYKIKTPSLLIQQDTLNKLDKNLTKMKIILHGLCQLPHLVLEIKTAEGFFMCIDA